MSLCLDIVGPSGALLHEEGLQSVVFRRRELAHEPGSEVAILSRHAPLLAQVQACDVRYRRGNDVYFYAVSNCLIEVWEDVVTVALT